MGGWAPSAHIALSSSESRVTTSDCLPVCQHYLASNTFIYFIAMAKLPSANRSYHNAFHPVGFQTTVSLVRSC